MMYYDRLPNNEQEFLEELARQETYLKEAGYVKDSPVSWVKEFKYFFGLRTRKVVVTFGNTVYGTRSVFSQVFRVYCWRDEPYRLFQYGGFGGVAEYLRWLEM